MENSVIEKGFYECYRNHQEQRYLTFIVNIVEVSPKDMNPYLDQDRKWRDEQTEEKIKVGFVCDKDTNDEVIVYETLDDWRDHVWKPAPPSLVRLMFYHHKNKAKKDEQN